MADELPDLIGYLNLAVGQFEDERNDFWRKRLEAEEWSRLKELRERSDEIAEMITGAAGQLALPAAGEPADLMRAILKDYSQDQYRRWLAFLQDQTFPPKLLGDLKRLNPFEKFVECPTGESSLRMVWERMCIELASDAIRHKVESGAHRQLLLAQLLVEANPPEPTVDYLKHVASCFIWGFDTECVILCRSVIDTALRETIPESLCESRGPRPRFGYTLANRLEAALPTLIEKECYEAGIRVNERGTKAVHYEPGATTDVLGTIQDTLTVVRALCTAT